ncbi:MAG TPA: NAD-dependent epimerase/dehydratase family protein [Stellaceae bacterium]|jgi:UDP-glucuronate 4-epimerase|nr:NAD-dependent epimerase/dehydratase family protein [Stellaceae bacterium]
MTILVTGVAGFIGNHVADALLARGQPVLGLDIVNDYYDVALKQARLARLDGRKGYEFVKIDLADTQAMQALAVSHPDIEAIVHLAAQAGVRYSLQNPRAYIQSNLVGHLEILELARNLKACRHLVYASSSSVYGASEHLPFSLEDRADQPQSLYAATKRSDEMLSYSYAHLYGIAQTGIRFFTVYGPWGRPDMAPYIFTRAILAGETIRLFNRGEMMRDFTYIDDAAAGVLAALDKPPAGVPPHRVYNIGNNNAEPLAKLVSSIEEACGRKAIIELAPMQPGDVRQTYADIEAARRDLDFAPRTSLEAGIARFVDWYRDYHKA